MRSPLKLLGSSARALAVSPSVDVCAVCGAAIEDDDRRVRVRGILVHHGCASYRVRGEHDRTARQRRRPVRRV